MIRLINVRAYALFISALLISTLFPSIAAAKHIIVIYDVSGSMVSLKAGTRINTFMESEDIRRVNQYLTDILFINTAQPLRDIDDSYIKECDPGYVGKPLYEKGDVLTYAEYAKQRVTKLNRAAVGLAEFQRQLPNPTTLKTAFYGMVSYLLRAEVEVYDALHNEADDDTYWVFVTDGDIDNSGKSDPGISQVLKRHAEIEDEFYSPMIFGMLVNNHVRIQIRRLQKGSDINTIFFATPTKPGQSLRDIQLTPDNEGKFISETLTLKTHNSEKPKFKLNSIDVEVVDKFNKPVQVGTEDGKLGVIEVPPVLLHGNPPPAEFRIPFPAHKEIAAPGNALKLEVLYSFNNQDKIYSPQPIQYAAVIDSIYLANMSTPEQQAKELRLEFADGVYLANLIVGTESYDKGKFRIDQLQCYVTYKDGRKLCDATVPIINRLGEYFSVEVPKQDHLDWFGNKMVFEINYKYNNQSKSTTIEIPYKLIGGRFPAWLLWVFLVPILGVVIFLLIRQFIPQPIVHSILLTEVSEADTPLGGEVYFTLEDDVILEFGPRGPEDLQFDVGSDGYLHTDKKTLRLFLNEDDAEGVILNLPETLTLNRSEGDDTVRVRCEMADDEASSESEEEEDPIIASNTDDDDPTNL